MNRSATIIKPVAAIICDEIRQESSRKDILIGIYPADIVLNRSPMKLRLSVYLLVEITDSGETEFEVRFQGPDGPSENTIKGTLEGIHKTIPKHRIGLSLHNLIINMSKEGVLKTLFRKPGERWKTVSVLPVTLAPDVVISSNEPEQPA